MRAHRSLRIFATPVLTQSQSWADNQRGQTRPKELPLLSIERPDPDDLKSVSSLS